jgi:hypothetical protein
MNAVSKTQERILTVVGAIFGLAVGAAVTQKVIGPRMVEAPKFLLAVFVGGAVGFFIYTLIKDGGTLLLRKQAQGRPAGAAPQAAAAPPPPAAEPPTEEWAPPQPDAPTQRERPLRPLRGRDPRD